MAAHENLARRQEIEGSSDRAFGLVFAVVFLIVAAYPLLGGGGIRWWSVGLSAAFLVLAVVFPMALRPLNRLWFRFGMLLHRFVMPIVMAVIYYLVLTPIAAVTRLFSGDPLRIRLDEAADTYWIDRSDAVSEPSSMLNQF